VFSRSVSISARRPRLRRLTAKRQGWFLALADEPAVAVDHEPPAVAGQAPRLDHGLAEVDGPPGLQRIDVDRREPQ
jgi:hypothetical protein